MQSNDIETSNTFQKISRGRLDLLTWFCIDLINHIIQTEDYHREGHIDKITLNDCQIDHSVYDREIKHSNKSTMPFFPNQSLGIQCVL